MAYKFAIKAHESSHVPEGISAITFKWCSCDVVTRDMPSFLKLVTFA